MTLRNISTFGATRSSSSVLSANALMARGIRHSRRSPAMKTLQMHLHAGNVTRAHARKAVLRQWKRDRRGRFA
jgi:hypothetical protein